MANRRYLRTMKTKSSTKLTLHSLFGDVGKKQIYIEYKKKTANLVVSGLHEGPLAIQLQIGLQIVAAVCP
jgi:hypothetical protein